MTLPRLALVLFLLGCPGLPADPPGDLVDRMATLAQQIERNPAAAEVLVEAEGLTPERYREVMFRIARDPDMTARFLKALQRPSGSGGLPGS